MDKIKYYSFDMFDTLITRLLNEPGDLFSIIEEKYELPNFKKKRFEAENTARKNSKYEDITIDDIYNQLKIIDSSIDTDKVEKIEKELEIKLCIVNENFINTYYSLKESDKKIVIISDMYLDTGTIKKILLKNNIYYDKLYLSSEIKKAKFTGSLYDYVLNDLNIESDQIIHYGDNKTSDVINPRKKGIKSILVNNKWKDNLTIYNSKEKDYKYLAIEKFINFNMKNKFSDSAFNYFYKTGYQTLGPLLYGYCVWLNECLKSDNINNVFFLSRDGKIIKKAFDILFPDFNTHYMFASRRGLIVPSLCIHKELKDPANLKNVYLFYDEINLGDLSVMLGLDDVDLIPILEKYNFNLLDKIDLEFISNDLEFKSFYNEIYPLIIKNSRNEYMAMRKYLNEINFSGKLGIVDIGWQGNMQFALENAIDFSKIDAKIKGFYIGVSCMSKKQEIQDMRGYLYQKDYNERIEHDKNWYADIFEFFFSSTDGSFKRYVDGGFEFYEYEYKNSKVKKYLEKIQDGAIDFVLDFSKSELSNIINITPSIAISNFNKLGNRPSNDDLNYFKEMSFYDKKLIPFISNSRDNYIFHPKSFLRDYRNSLWKPGFLNLIFCSNFDYSKLLNYYSNLLNFIKRD